MSTTSPLSNFLNILVAPGEAFASIKERPVLFYPMAAVIVAVAGSSLFYFATVDFAWLVDNMVAMAPGDAPPDAQEAMRETYESMGSTIFMVITTVQVAITYLIVWVIAAGYLSIVSAVKNDGFKFPNWLALECWSAVPMILVSAAMAINVLVHGDGQLSLLKLNPLTLNNLLFDLNAGEQGAQFWAALHLGTFWSAALKIKGYAQWTQRSLAGAAAIVLVPYVLWFGGLALFAFVI